ncbi:nuclear RNA export factor 1 [Monomorium pharaonis]|uniref:nuclear RNA export factor 1 n=1 Tax=Monomorium pharaonis TaxID=307658 RepID=UPI00063F7EAB|nr:nuclear RNA export factor 1 [Monomorium pharaonis]XP_012536528.1 nuclear RNA export factor 1 [Monomorium pharaonis]XP_036149684.1 nuclear RNA export factor 1 [Monomorium pharaonis]
MKKQEKLQPNTPVVPITLDTAITIRIAMGAKMPHERGLMNRADMWHKIKVVKGGLYDKDTVLKGILKAVEPNDLIPVKYQVCGEDGYFVCRNCGPALEMLCKANMIVKNANGDALILVVTLGFSSINDLRIHIQPLLLTALTKRYNPNRRTLNLENFHTDPNIQNIVFCPLSQPRTSNHVLKLASTAIATFENLNLQHNELLSISTEISSLTSVKYLDLRNNSLLNMNVLMPLRNLEILKLWLDGNPLCENYSTAKQYVDSAKKYCPYLQELDGVCIVENMPLIYKDYFTDDKSQHFAYTFVTHFFGLFDQLDRTVLRGLYHKDAFYSMSFAIPHNIAQKTGLNQYLSNRNLLRKGQKKHTTDKHLYRGQEDILAAFSKLPRSYHDKTTFTYDIMYQDDNCKVFSVSGLFKKLSSGTNVLSFSRTFILLASADNEYHILNDQYHIFAAPANMTPDRIVVKYTYDEVEPVCFSPSEKSVLITRMQQITKMNKEWSENYLSEAQWDMRKAIYSFMKDLKDSTIPNQAFAPQSS